jgi:hypothetical protein
MGVGRFECVECFGERAVTQGMVVEPCMGCECEVITRRGVRPMCVDCVERLSVYDAVGDFIRESAT